MAQALSSTFRVFDYFPSDSYAAWHAQVVSDLKGKDFERALVSRTADGIAVQPLYTGEAAHGGAAAKAHEAAWPGVAPYLRGVRGAGAAAAAAAGIAAGGAADVDQQRREQRAPWRVWQRFAGGDWAAARKWARQAKDGGTDGFVLHVGPSWAGPGLPLTAGVAQTSGSNAWTRWFAEVGPSVWLQGRADQPEAALACLGAWEGWLQENQSAGGDGLRAAWGNLGFDPVATLAQNGALRGGWQASLEVVAASVRRLADLGDAGAGLMALEVSGLPYHCAGATAAQELGCLLAVGASYLRTLCFGGKRGVGSAVAGAGIAKPLAVDVVLSRLAVTTALTAQPFEAIAKLRALRVLWAKMTAACGADVSAQAVQVMGCSSPRMLTVRDPWVNMLRTSVAGFAAAVAGVDGLLVAPFDAAVAREVWGHGESGVVADRLGRNTQHLLALESHLGQVTDAAGGSWYVESLTEALAAEAWAMFRAIEGRGGMLTALADGWLLEHLNMARKAATTAMAMGKAPVTGVSAFPWLDEPELETAASGEATTAVAGERGNGLAGRDDDGDGDSAAVPGERAAIPLPWQRTAAPFETLRAAARAWGQQQEPTPVTGPSVCLIPLGPVAEHLPRVNFATNFLAAGGIGVRSLLQSGDASLVEGDLASACSRAVQGWQACLEQVCVVAGADARYHAMLPQLVAALRKVAGPGLRVVVAGRGLDCDGCDSVQWIHMRSHMLEVLTGLLEDLGVSASGGEV